MKATNLENAITEADKILNPIVWESWTVPGLETTVYKGVEYILSQMVDAPFLEFSICAKDGYHVYIHPTEEDIHVMAEKYILSEALIKT